VSPKENKEVPTVRKNPSVTPLPGGTRSCPNKGEIAKESNPEEYFKMIKTASITAVMTLFMALSQATSPLEAQGNRGGARQEQGLAEQDRDRELRRLREFGRAPVRGNGSGKVPPGWCKGVGNPHNTPENCGYRSATGQRDRYPIDSRYPGDDRRRTDQGAHNDFHNELDRHYARLAAQRPLDLRFRAELELQKRAEHEQWHRETGIRH